MSDMNLYVVGSWKEHAAFDIVFIHGLMGDAHSSWSHNGKPEGFWPRWLSEEFPAANVWVFNHPAGAAGSILSDDGMSILQRAQAAITSFETEDIGSRPIIFITHSLGGLITKKLLRIAFDSVDEDVHRIFENTDSVIFLATPHNGSFLANFGSALAKILTGGLIKPKKIVTELKSGHEPTYELDNWYRDNCSKNIKTIVFAETEKTAGVTQVVSTVSSNPGIPGVMVRPTDKDHIEIAKPTSIKDPVYRYICKQIQKKSTEFAQDGLNQSELLDDYDYFTAKAPGDRRTLEQKLCDAGRSYEVTKAERSKERAAMKLQKYGLFETVTEVQIKLLGDIYSRFKNVETVIHDGASNTEIDTKLESSVISPILETDKKEAYSHGKVMDGVYYLTGNCHLDWGKKDET
ncbi:ABC-three component system protein [Kordiimonas lacus]|uniref:ABC-three component systems C-terminal domain-containing protein n=1 Tax=Kordiimonas lacus TaxID=637679 RepID=A0A1G7E081_9PROT|nr:ABC-three component system protein [Kordiimonas lacus]SDE57064.1 hypothetical protein SAMN04488071_3225 [Kordiimonas lacus]